MSKCMVIVLMTLLDTLGGQKGRFISQLLLHLLSFVDPKSKKTMDWNDKNGGGSGNDIPLVFTPGSFGFQIYSVPSIYSLLSQSGNQEKYFFPIEKNANVKNQGW